MSNKRSRRDNRKPQGQTNNETKRIDSIKPLTGGQQDYIDCILSNDITFGIGPAGTGKTFLATIMAVQALLDGEVEKIILVRPIVESGEKLGFLPGTFQDKVDPYMRPIYDAMGEVLSPSQIKQYMESGIIEIAPLAFMRGRSLNKCFIILDEAQNTTKTQMLMLLTRIGRRSKAVITGDFTQIDLVRPQDSGLEDAINKLEGIDGIGICELESTDIVRHRLVQDIIAAYNKS